MTKGGGTLPSPRRQLAVLLLLVTVIGLGAATATAADTGTTRTVTPAAVSQPAEPTSPLAGPGRAGKCFGPDVVCTAGQIVINADDLIGYSDEVGGAVVQAGVASAADSTFGAIAGMFGEAGVSLLRSLAEAFVSSSTVDLSKAGIDPILAIATPLAMLAAVLLIVVAAGRAAVSGSGSVIATALVGIVKAVLVTVLIVTVVQTALYATDEVSRWIIARSLGNNAQLEDRLGALITVGALGASPPMIFIFGLLAIVLALILWVELLFRRVAIVVLVALAPLAAAGQVLGETGEWWAKARTALIQLILLKPVMALCFAVGFSTFGSSEDLIGVIAGFVTLGLAVLAWPLLAKFMTFTSVGTGAGMAAGLLGSAAGGLAGSRMGSPSAGPAAESGSGFTMALERENDSSASTTAAAASGGGSKGAGAVRALAAAGGGAGTAALAAAGTVAAAGHALVDQAEGQMSAGAVDSGLGHSATRPSGSYGGSGRRQGGGRHAAPAPAATSRPSYAGDNSADSGSDASDGDGDGAAQATEVRAEEQP